MGWVDVLETLLVVLTPLVVDMLVLLLNFDREDWASIYELLSVGGTIFGEVHIYKAGESVSVSSHSNISVLICSPIDNLFLEPFPLIPVASIG